MRRLLVLAIVLGACSPGPTAQSTAHLELSEFAIATSAPLWDSDLTRLDITNSGDFGHTLIITDAASNVVASVDVIPAGQGATLDVSLPQGRYEISCRIVVGRTDGSIVDHFEEGMRTTVQIGA